MGLFSWNVLTKTIKEGIIVPEKKVQNKREEVEVKEVESGGNKYSLPYGIAKGLGLSTKGMTPSEVGLCFPVMV